MHICVNTYTHTHLSLYILSRNKEEVDGDCKFSINNSRMLRISLILIREMFNKEESDGVGGRQGIIRIRISSKPFSNQRSRTHRVPV